MVLLIRWLAALCGLCLLAACTSVPIVSAPTPTPAVTPTHGPDALGFANGHTLRGAFRDFWTQNDGAATLGLPLTEALWVDGVEAQYFERGRLERDPAGTVNISDLGGISGDEALSLLPAHQILRGAAAVPSPQRAAIQPIEALAQPLQPVRAMLQSEAVSGSATIFWGDRSGRFWSDSLTLSGPQTEVQHIARGSLGPQGATIMIDGRIAGISSAVYRLDASTAITTGEPRFDELVPRVKAFMDQDVSEYTIDGVKVRGYRSPDNSLLWLRDHVHQGKGYAYWEQDMTSLLDQFRRLQRPNGAFDDYLGSFDFGPVHGRKEVEADLEYLFIEGVYRAWQATGDDEWLRRQVDAMELGLSYAMSDPQRWDATRRLVKRPFTIDTWDFEIGPPTTSPDGNIAPRHWIDEQTKWSIFHGDNTGYAHAMNLLARIYDHLGEPERAAHWRSEARGLIQRLNALAWNGRFYRHMVHLTPVEVPVDEEQQLSLSNSYALNRGVLTPEQAATIIQEYQQRRRPPEQAFAEWYSIDPPFPAGVTSMPENARGHRPGEYVNGGIMPLVGGELARGAFSHGYEEYGFDILQRYYSLIAGTNASYLWYYPIGQPGISGAETIPTDGWGSSAMLAALIEGAAGVRDEGTRFSEATIAPRWTIAREVDTARVTLRYGASDGYLAYRWERLPDGLRLSWTGSGDVVNLHLLLPADAPDTIRATLDEQPQSYTISTIRASRYLDLHAAGSGTLVLNW
jgi:hypothetical protein